MDRRRHWFFILALGLVFFSLSFPLHGPLDHLELLSIESAMKHHGDTMLAVQLSALSIVNGGTGSTVGYPRTRVEPVHRPLPYAAPSLWLYPPHRGTH